MLVVVLSWKNTFSFFAFVWEVHFPGGNSDLGFGEASVFRGGKLSVCFFRKLDQTMSENRTLEADLFAFDTDTRQNDFKLVGKRLVRLVHIRSGGVVYDANT